MINFASRLGSLKFWIATTIVTLILAATLAAYFSASAAARDNQRLSDIKAIQSALQIYFKENGFYPNGFQVEMSDSLSSYLDRWPTAPKASGSCTASQNRYLYSQVADGTDYNLIFCLGKASGGLNAGLHTATAASIQ